MNTPFLPVLSLIMLDGFPALEFDGVSVTLGDDMTPIRERIGDSPVVYCPTLQCAVDGHTDDLHGDVAEYLESGLIDIFGF